jgi:HEPN domain-containing protein
VNFPGMLQSAMDRSNDWLKQADRDLAAARNCAAGGFHEWAAFASQQSAEKAAKALAQFRKGSSRGHSITGILNQLMDASKAPDDILNAARELDQVYITARYPNGFAQGSPGDYFSGITSERLLRHANTILEFCRSQIS